MSQEPSLFSSPLLQESAERQQLSSSLQEERERLQAAHAAQLENLRFQFEKQTQEMKLEPSRMVRQQTLLIEPRLGADVAEKEVSLSLLMRNQRCSRWQS